MLVTVIGRGHGGTRAMSQTLAESGVYMGEPLNPSWDLVPPEDMYEACRVVSRYVEHLGGLRWDFSRLHTMPIDPEFTRLIESYLVSVLASDAEHKGWKIPETVLVYPWIIRLFPEACFIHWVRDPRDSILGAHVTDDLADFDIAYDPTDDPLLKRAISYRYQREIVKATPPPARTVMVRFEDFIFEQERELSRLETFLDIPLAKIEMRRDPAFRWKREETPPHFDFLAEDIGELGYEPYPAGAAV
jgi:hypothetical protein